MSRVSTGTKPWLTKSKVWVTKITLGERRPVIALPTCREKDEDEAVERAAVLAELGKRMILAGVPYDQALAALRRKVAPASGGRKLEVASALVERLIGGWRPTSDKPLVTLEDFAALWWDGVLAAANPRKAKRRKNYKPAKANLKRYVLPRFGKLPVEAFTLADAESIADDLGELCEGSQRQVLSALNVLLTLAALPLRLRVPTSDDDHVPLHRLIEHNPIPRQWLPKAGKTRALQWLYPSEERVIAACTKVPEWFRLYVGFLIREGGRPVEPTLMSVAQFNAEHGTASLLASQVKTKSLRTWPLQVGTVRALHASLAKRGELKPTDPLFVDGDGERIRVKAEYSFTYVDDNGVTITTPAMRLPAMLRYVAKLAGITRPELFEYTEESRALCMHDLRRSCITCRLALGWTEAQISALTGHVTSQELNGYRVNAPLFAAQREADFAPLDLAIPELAAVSASVRSPANVHAEAPKSSKPANRFAIPGTGASSMVELGASAQPIAPIEKPAFSHVGEAKQALIGVSPDASQTLRLAELEDLVATLKAQLAQAQAPRSGRSKPAKADALAMARALLAQLADADAAE